MFSLGENSFLNCTDFYTNDATAWSHDMDDIQRFGIDLLCCWSGIEEALDCPAAVGGGQLLDYLFEETCRGTCPSASPPAFTTASGNAGI